MSFAWFEQLPNILKKLYMKKLGSLISYENNERTNFSSTQARLEVFWFIICMPWGTLTLSFVWFEQLPNILKKLYMKKGNSLISYENNERTNFSSTQARLAILFDS